MEALSDVVADAMRMIQHRESRPNRLQRINERLRIAFDAQLGGRDILCEGEGIRSGDHMLRVVIDQGGVSVLFYVNGMRERCHNKCGGTSCLLTKGEGRVFKFLQHTPDTPIVLSNFYSLGFPYRASELRRLKNGKGTIACVKALVTNARFCINEDTRITTEGIVHDLRAYERIDLLIEGVRKVFERIICGTDAEWERIFRSLFR